jgi:hypothetical protein
MLNNMSETNLEIVNHRFDYRIYVTLNREIVLTLVDEEGNSVKYSLGPKQAQELGVDLIKHAGEASW